MFKKLMAAYNFRTGRRNRDAAKLSLATRQDRYNVRAAIELSRMGTPDAVCQAIMLTFSGLREYASRHPLDPAIREFLQLPLSTIENSRAQCFQDIAALTVTDRKQNGFFVEVGTGNGELLSNTFLMEKQYGWKGILFEPDRRFHESIAEKRSAILDQRPVYSTDDKVLQFLEVTRSGELSTLNDFRREDRRFRQGALRDVQTTTLTSAFRKHNAPRDIDYISIDTEGSELEVLKGLDLNEYNVKFLTIEHNYVAGKAESLAAFLAPYGFRPYLTELSCQDIWLVRD